MKPITALVNQTVPSIKSVLPVELRRLYGGDLTFPQLSNRPYVIGNFVSTLDGVVSFKIPGQAGGGEIGGFNEPDQFIMGLLRAYADAVMVASGTLHGDPGHVRIPRFIYPKADKLYKAFRLKRKMPANPLNVIITGSGKVDLREPTFSTPALKTLIVTTKKGRAQLEVDHGTGLSVTQVRTVQGGERISAAAILKILSGEFGVKLLLHEGGPTLFGAFLAEDLIDELFLTIAPQVAGRSKEAERPGFAEGVAFNPGKAPWFEIVTLKQADNHLFNRLRFQR